MRRVVIPRTWAASAHRIVENRWQKILVIGATDRGKSTYCRFLARHLSDSGARVAFVDADVGQKDAGPPATIALTYPERGAALSQAHVAGLYFVGAVSPAGHFLHMVVGTRRMVDAAVADFVIINTTGLVHGPGRLLKAMKIESLHPDVVVAIAKGNELAPLIRAHPYCNVIRLRPSPQAAPRSARVRRLTRELGFRRYFASARKAKFDLRQLTFQRSPLFAGTPFRDPRFMYAERTPEGIVAVTEESRAVDAPRVRVVPAGFERDIVCGLADRRGEVLGLGIVQEFDFRRMQITILTPVPKDSIRIVQLGALRLGADGRERGDGSSSD